MLLIVLYVKKGQNWTLDHRIQPKKPDNLKKN